MGSTRKQKDEEVNPMNKNIKKLAVMTLAGLTLCGTAVAAPHGNARKNAYAFWREGCAATAKPLARARDVAAHLALHRCTIALPRRGHTEADTAITPVAGSRSEPPPSEDSSEASSVLAGKHIATRKEGAS